jgi:hypothetical protein
VLRLEAIIFNHDPLSAANGVNLRRDVARIVPVPEWRRFVSVNPEDSVVAYAVSEARQATPTILAQFRRTDPALTSVEVRSIDPTGGQSVLGTAGPRWVTFTGGEVSPFVALSLAQARLRTSGVGVHDLRWRWQYRPDPQQPWTDFAESRHRVYTVLSVPRPPWQQQPYVTSNTQLPWTGVLDYSCRWAASAQTLDEAAALVTEAVFELGPEVIEYGCVVFGTPQYSVPYFHCGALLERLRGGPGRGRWVNCTDCATIVSTFSNILGCRLWQSTMGLSFALNEILAIGASEWRTACDWGGFNYHEVAWKGGCTEADAVFDACLLVDGDLDPTRAPHQPLLATNLRFGNPGDGDYRDRLAAPAGRANCRPLPSTRQHRLVG